MGPAQVLLDSPDFVNFLHFLVTLDLGLQSELWARLFIGVILENIWVANHE